MRRVTVKSGIADTDGHEEQITEYLCDSPECPNIAAHVLACVKEIGLSIALCEEHAARLRART